MHLYITGEKSAHEKTIGKKVRFPMNTNFKCDLRNKQASAKGEQ